MEKVIQIDGKQIRFVSTAGTPRRYRFMTGGDILEDSQKFVAEAQKGKLSRDALTAFENLAYIMAKQGNPDIPGTPDEWLDGFETFSIYNILPQLIELWTDSTQGIEQAKKKTTP